MIRPIRWNTFIRDLFVIQIGYALFGVAIALTIRANLGTGTWPVLEVALARMTGWSVGAITIVVGFVVLAIALALGEKIGWGTLGNILFIGLWLDLMLWLIPPVEANLPLQSAMLLGGILLQGVATAVYIGVDVGAGPRDSLMLAMHRATKLSLRMARGSVEVTVLAIGWLMGGPVGIGTAVFALLIGPSIQWAFKVFDVHPHRELEKAGAE
ncbi:MAG: hypothetical protein DCC59_09835 [Chloroflexi bacterium]|nr:hypothetical protein [Chloroflexi bacterium CFX1]MCK6566649.1 hypothetical protein [Anaerolineales bacterium]MCQ3953092.1 hypothetical protein [Chloroflexota bacterium]MDL1920074.1 hypothetical protein [Chloroflexi bacterium CFX5]NUQ60437.1 hypothetical protein [Anaerolineales bacterium]